jgi:hypothetical protein
MKKIMPKIAGLLFGAFLVGVFGLVISLTFSALGRIFPNNFGNQLIGLALFDLAALAWGLAFVYKSESTGQYAIAAIGFIVGLAGTVVMIASEVTLSAQGLVEAPEWIGKALTYGFITSAVMHLILGYMHKAASPEIDASIRLGAAQAEVTNEAIKQAESELELKRAQMGNVIKARLVGDIQRNLNIAVDPEIGFVPASPVEYAEVTAPKKSSPSAWLSNMWRKGKKPPMVTNEQVIVDVPKLQEQPAPKQEEPPAGDAPFPGTK